MQDHDRLGEVATAFVSGLRKDADRWRADLDRRIESLKPQLDSPLIDSMSYLELSSCYASIRNHAAAVDVLRRAAERFPHEGDVHYSLLRMLHKCGLDEEAVDAGKRASELLPSLPRLEYELYLPKVYESEQAMNFYHHRFSEGLNRCIAACKLGTTDEALRWARAFSRFVPFYLAYQGYDDLPLIRRYGEFLHRVMSAAYPQWSGPRSEIKPPARSRPRVGFVSAYFRRHTVGEHFLGWLTQRDPSSYEARCYYLGTREDAITAEYRRASDAFFACRDLEKMCEAIVRDHLDCLVFTDVGMDPMSSQMAALRLAPTQCVAWGHPVSTGLPTMDYFLSADLMEASDAGENYTEQLVKLPGLGICYRTPVLPHALLTKTRADFGLAEEAVVYLCCQSLFKFLPQYDQLLAEIALAVPTARFVFISDNELLGRKLMHRLEGSFAAVGLRATDYCDFLPEQGTFDYWNLHRVSDVFLDPPGWSGGRSTLDALGCGLPIVTMPSRYARHRQSQAMLRILGVSEMIARDKDQYIALSVRLGRDPGWRHEIAERMVLNSRALLAAEHIVQSVDQFFATTSLVIRTNEQP